MTDDTMRALIAASRADLWQKEDGSTREYDHIDFAEEAS